jgi:hypothetical protein
MVAGIPVTTSGVALSMTSISMSSNTILLCFRFENVYSYTQQVNVAVHGDLCFNGYNSAPVSNLAQSRGFKVSSDSRQMTFICRGYPLVSDVSSSWYGRALSRANYLWTRCSDLSSSGDS